MKISLYVLAAATSLVLIPATCLAAPRILIEHGLLVEVVHRGVTRALPPVGYWRTAPYLHTGPSSWRYYNFQSYGASPGQPGSPTYAPYAGLPPLRRSD
jgi:hypothetical protein